MKFFLKIITIFWLSICSVYGQDTLLKTVGIKGKNEFIQKTDTQIHFRLIDTSAVFKSLIHRNFYTHIISINTLALCNGDLTLFYDKLFNNGKFVFTVMGGYNFNTQMNGLNMYIVNSKYNAKKMYDMGGGFYFAPRPTQRIYYFAGLLGKYMTYRFTDMIGITNNQKQFEVKEAYQLSLLFSNGCVFNIAPTIHFKVMCAIGKQINSIPLKSTNLTVIDYSNFPKLYLGYCIGYCF